MVGNQLAGQYKQQSKGTKVIAELVEQLGWGYWVLGETDGDSDFIYDIENDFVEVEVGRVFSLNKITPKNECLSVCPEL